MWLGNKGGMMTLPNETILTGASNICEVCKKPFEIKVCRSNAGYYIGTMCCNGPHSRESGYYPSYEDAETMLSLWKEDNYVDARYV
jgi:hypothetical protein